MCRYADREEFEARHYRRAVSSQYVGANPRGRPLGQVQGLPLPRFIEKLS